jgi:hypothetical protein
MRIIDWFADSLIINVEAGARSSELNRSSISSSSSDDALLPRLVLVHEPSEGTADSLEENLCADASVDIDLEFLLGTTRPTCCVMRGALIMGYWIRGGLELRTSWRLACVSAMELSSELGGFLNGSCTTELESSIDLPLR